MCIAQYTNTTGQHSSRLGTFLVVENTCVGYAIETPQICVYYTSLAKEGLFLRAYENNMNQVITSNTPANGQVTIKLPSGHANRLCGQVGLASFSYPGNPSIYDDQTNMGAIAISDELRCVGVCHSDGTITAKLLSPTYSYIVGKFNSYYAFCDSIRPAIKYQNISFWRVDDSTQTSATFYNFIKQYNPYYLVLYSTSGPHGQALLEQNFTLYTKWAQQAQSYGCCPLAYFDFGHIGTPKNAIDYPEAVVQDALGKTVFYPGTALPLMVPFGDYQRIVVSIGDSLLSTTGIKGLYVDICETGYELYSHNPRHPKNCINGCCLPMLTQAFRKSYLTGKVAICNGAPYTLNGPVGQLRINERWPGYGDMTTPIAYFISYSGQADADKQALKAINSGYIPLDAMDVGYQRDHATFGSYFDKFTLEHASPGNLTGLEKIISTVKQKYFSLVI